MRFLYSGIGFNIALLGLSTVNLSAIAAVENQILNVGSRQIVRLSLDVNVQGIQLKESIGLFKTGKQIFQVIYVYDNESSQQAMPVFEQIINTFKATSKT